MIIVITFFNFDSSDPDYSKMDKHLTVHRRINRKRKLWPKFSKEANFNDLKKRWCSEYSRNFFHCPRSVKEGYINSRCFLFSQFGNFLRYPMVIRDCRCRGDHRRETEWARNEDFRAIELPSWAPFPLRPRFLCVAVRTRWTVWWNGRRGD